MSGWWVYRHHGLVVRSEIEIAALATHLLEHDDKGVDVTVRLGNLSCHPDAEVGSITPREYRFAIAGIGAYWVRDGKEIVVHPLPGVADREACLFLLGTAWTALCYQRGILCLHASVVESGGAAMAFCGPSGSGKSTMAGWLLRRGGRFISDDLSRFDSDDPAGPMVYPSAPQLKLWSDGVARLGLGAQLLNRDYFRQDKYHIATSAPHLAPVRVNAIYLLAWGLPALTRIRGKVALSRLISAATHRSYLLEPMGVLADHWKRCLRLVQCVPVFELRRPRDWAGMDNLAEILETAHRNGAESGREAKV